MKPVPGPSQPAGVVIPLRAFASGKARLAAVLNDDERTELATMMANRVVAAAGLLPIVVVSSAPEVQAWADGHGLCVVDDPGDGLDGAVVVGASHLRDRGFARLIVAHADLPRARPGALERFGATEPDIVTIVPCHRDDGTPILSVPAEPTFPFSYGIGSARRHAALARQLGLAVRIVRDRELGYDIDLPEDLPTS
jgi:2-phospho-L-lactate guanylyltransferase CofC